MPPSARIRSPDHLPERAMPDADAVGVSVSGPGPAPSAASADAVWARIVEAASDAYRGSDAHARRFARAKLGHDRVFRHVLTKGLVAPAARVLDLGCGQGLFASLLQASAAEALKGNWPATWAPAPEGARVTGIDPLALDIERARKALGSAASFIPGDMRAHPLPPSDVVVFFDTLHYISPVEQDAVLVRAREALAPGGVLLLRAHDGDHRLRYHYGLWVDRLTMGLHGGGYGRLAGRTPQAWMQALQALGLETESLPMNGRPPFSNRLFIGRLTGAS